MRNSVLNLLNIKQVEEEDTELFPIVSSLYLKTGLIDILIAKLPFLLFNQQNISLLLISELC